jgi:glycerol-3-phosphate acyltransferase PlsY
MQLLRKIKKMVRKAYHLSGFVLIILYAYLGRQNGLIMLACVFLITLVLDIVRLKTRADVKLWGRHLSSFLKDSEKNALTSSPWYVLGTLCAAAFFDLPVAVAAVAFLAFGDASATAVGERRGRTKLWGGKKSLEGTLAFFIASAVAGGVSSRYYSLPLTVIIAGAASAAIVEILPLKVNDNLTIPLLSGAVMQLIVRLS